MKIKVKGLIATKSPKSTLRTLRFRLNILPASKTNFMMLARWLLLKRLKLFSDQDSVKVNNENDQIMSHFRFQENTMVDWAVVGRVT